MTPEQLKQICPKCNDPEGVAAALTATFEKGGITDPNEQAAFIAQSAHESAQFNTMVENLNYGAEGLAGTWPNRYAVDPKAKKKVPNETALRIARNPEAIANNCYANRMGNGDEASGEGWLYRGRGWKMVTGKSNYTECAEATGLDCVNNPDILATPEGSSASALWFWQKNNCAAAVNNCKKLTKIINGGEIGLAERERLTALARDVLVA